MTRAGEGGGSLREGGTPLDGMRESEGVADAIAHARKLGIPLNQVRMAASDDAPQPFELAAQPRWWI